MATVVTNPAVTGVPDPAGSGASSVSVAATGAFTPISASTPARVTSSATAKTVMAANVSAKVRWINNDDPNGMWILEAASGTVSSTNYTTYISTGGRYEFPIGPSGVPYQGLVTGIWAAAGGGAAQCCEQT